jgi:hypothetical protein
MPRLRLMFWSALGLLLIIALTVATIKYSQTAALALPLNVPPGDQEIAWFHTATNTSTWDRFVAGVHHAARQQPRLTVDDSQAFLDQSTGVPEVVLSLDGSAQKLRIRWYKQTAQVKVSDWVAALAKRDPPPLAIVGGGSSDRALELARVLALQTDWHGPPPLLLLTTATANNVYVGSSEHDDRLDLMTVYLGRTFRFCFTNRQMARAILQFVWQNQELRPFGPPIPSLCAVGSAAGGDFWGPIACLAAQGEFPPEVFALEWKDDPYSMDLSEQFRGEFFDAPDNDAKLGPRAAFDRAMPPQSLPIPSSVGGFLRPNRGEGLVLDWLLSDAPPFGLRALPRNPLQRSLLILPAVPQPARRILAGLSGADPELGGRLVALSGDSISFNHVYRDGDLVWNIRLVPVPLVFFAHQNPVAWAADEAPTRGADMRFGLFPPDGTDDVLHFADVTRILAEAAFGLKPSVSIKDDLLTNSDELKKRLQQLEPPYFDNVGNRRGGQGEYVLCLRPQIVGGFPRAMLEVWAHKGEFGWIPVRPPLEVKYR